MSGSNFRKKSYFMVSYLFTYFYSVNDAFLFQFSEKNEIREKYKKADASFFEFKKRCIYRVFCYQTDKL